MLTEQRYNEILKLVAARGSITVAELKDELNISESTARRDIIALDRLGRLEKVFGGAVAVRSDVQTLEPTVAQKTGLYAKEKRAIAQYAAALVEPSDFVYIDAGTTTRTLAELLPDDKSISYVTNGVEHAQILADKGQHVILVGGELKASTGAVVGNTAILMLQKYHFTKGFFGTNGISRLAGLTTPDANEALTKQTAMGQCRHCFCLSDSSKFDVISAVTFGAITQAGIITEEIPPAYREYPNITKV